MIEQALIVGDQTVLLMPSFHIFSSFKEKITHPIVFNVMERTNLASLNEGKLSICLISGLSLSSLF